MDDLPGSWIYLMFVGGTLICLAQSLCRRDGRWALAFGFAGIAAAELAGLPGAIIAWSLLGWLAAGVMAVLSLTARLINTRVPTLVLIGGAFALLAGPADARGWIADLSRCSPPAPILAVEALLRSMIAR